MKLRSMLLVLLFSAAGQLWAETTIGILDQNAALFRSEAAKIETEKLKQTYGVDEVRIRKLEEQVKELQTKLETDAVIMEESEKVNLQQQIQELLTERSSLIEKLNQIQNQRRTQFIRQYQSLLAQAIRSVVDEQELGLVVDSSAVIFAAETMDITAAVLERFNAMLGEEPAGAQ